MAHDTRERMIDAAALLLQREGYQATSWRRLVDEAGVPWGSIGHHFPGGKEELAVAAVDRGAAAVGALIDRCFAVRRTPATAVREWFEVSARLLAESGYSAGCPVATLALETAATSPALGEAARAAFAGWERRLTEHLASSGVRRAPALAGMVLTLLEGALVRARVERSPAPLHAAGRLAERLVREG